MISFKQYLKEYAPNNSGEAVRVGGIVRVINDELSRRYRGEPKLKKGAILHITEINPQGLVSFQKATGKIPPPIVIGKVVNGAETFKVGDEVELIKDFKDADRRSRKKGERIFVLGDHTFSESATAYDDVPTEYEKFGWNFTKLVGCIFLTNVGGLSGIAVPPVLLKPTGNVLDPNSTLYKKNAEWEKKVHGWDRWGGFPAIDLTRMVEPVEPVKPVET